MCLVGRAEEGDAALGQTQWVKEGSNRQWRGWKEPTGKWEMPDLNCRRLLSFMFPHCL